MCSKKRYEVISLRVLTNKELRTIMEALKCNRVVCDHELFVYYFFPDN